MATSSAALLLGRQFKQMQTDKDIPGISCGLVNNSVFEWEVMLMLDDESGGLFGQFTPPLALGLIHDHGYHHSRQLLFFS